MFAKTKLLLQLKIGTYIFYLDQEYSIYVLVRDIQITTSTKDNMKYLDIYVINNLTNTLKVSYLSYFIKTYFFMYRISIIFVNLLICLLYLSYYSIISCLILSNSTENFMYSLIVYDV